MADIIWGDVTNHAAALSAVDATAQADILAHVNDALDVDRFDGESGAKTKLLRIYLAAHFGQLLLDAVSGGAGPAMSKKLGDMEITYAGISSIFSDSEYGETTYGRTYTAMVRRSTGCRAGFVI